MLKPSSTTAIERTRDPQQLMAEISASDRFPVMQSIGTVQVDPLCWLESQPFAEKFTWMDRETSRVIAGAGASALVSVDPSASPSQTIAHCRSLIRKTPSLRFFGGLSFDGLNGWDNFGCGRFVAPRFLLMDGQLHITVMDRDDLTQAMGDLRVLHDESCSASTSLPSPISIKYSPTKDGWLSAVDEALTLIRSEVLEKIVLARKTTLTFDEAIVPWHVASKLNDHTYDCYVFGFQFDKHRAFVGATPERLFRRDGNNLHSEVIAGTRPRGVTIGEDQRLAYELLSSDKDQLEHDIVRKSIRQKLHKFVEHLSVDSHASVLRLANKQHLCSSVQGELRTGINEAALLERLHPTPAVGGYPTENALPEIDRLEPFNRGWYAAPVGWISSDGAEFVVGIRSGLVEGNTISLFSGAGIVQGSDPHQEWSEVEDKIRDFLDIFGES